MNNAVAQLQAVFQQQRQHRYQSKLLTYESRRQALETLHQLLWNNKEAIIDSISQDYGHRARYDTEILEMYTSLEAIRYAKRHLKKWMRPKKVAVSKWFKPASGKVCYQPKGVVGIVVPWNYPLLLSLHPLVDAIAAGNHCMVKMSEFTPHFSALLAKLIAEQFPSDVIYVTNGDVSVAEAFSRLPFDHLFFTGSPSVGQKVLQAASEHLTPVTLELGGKSPTLLAPDVDLKQAVPKIMQGKFYNAGQTCIAPDYVLLMDTQVAAFVELAKASVSRFYPDYIINPDYTAIIDERNYQRLSALIDDAVAKGAQHIPLVSSDDQALNKYHKFAPCLLLNVSDDMRIMQEEVFGPILPLKTVLNLGQALEYIKSHPDPLALYYFDHDKSRIEYVLANTVSGGVSVNETLLHASQNCLPFGGVGHSGMGRYHGHEGFLTFSNQRGVFLQSKWARFDLLRAPFGHLAKTIVSLMQRF